MSNIRKKLTTVLAALLCAILLCTTITLLPKTKTANAARGSAWTTVSDGKDLWKGGDIPFDSEVLKALAVALTGTENYNEIKQLIYPDWSGNDEDPNLGTPTTLTSSNFRSQQGGTNNVSVKFNGITWDAVHMTVVRDSYTNTADGEPAAPDNAGDIILTLWQSASGLQANKKFNTAYSSSQTSTYPSNMYSTSYMRAVILNAGTQYATSASALTTTNTQQADNMYKNFTMANGEYDSGIVEDSVIDFLVQPKDVAYQQTESTSANSSVNYLSNNDAYGTPSSGSWYKAAYNYGSKSHYSDWKNDYLWLPSLAETGDKDTTNQNGIWKTNAALRSNATTNASNSSYSYAWLRSAYYNSGSSINSLKTDGTTFGSSAPELAGGLAVRPAIHLNLTKAFAAAGDSAPEYPTDTEKEVTYDGTEQSYDLPTVIKSLNCQADVPEYYNAETRSITATAAGEYSVTFTPKTEGYWAEGHSNPVTFTLKINKKPIELEIELSSYTHEVGKPPASITASIKSPSDGVFAACDDWEALCSSVQFTVTGGISVDDLVNAAFGSYTVSATLVLDNYEVTFKSATYTIASHSTHKYDGDAEHIAGTKTHKVYCSYDGCSEYDTKPCDITSETPHDETCLSDGYTAYVCSACGDYTIKGANKKAHDFTDQPWVTDDNQHWHECSYGCNTTDTKADHRWQQKGEIVWDDDSGTRTDECKDCGKTRQITVYPGEKTVPTLKDKTYIYNGNAQEAELSDFEAGAMTLEYYDEYKSNNLGGAPAGAGKYYVKVTLTEDGSKFQGIEERFVWIEFVIQKKAIILEIELSGTGHEIGNAPESITASIKAPSSGVFVGGDDWEVLCNGVQFTVTDCNVLEDLINAAVGSYEVNAILVLDNYDVTIKPVKYEIVAHEHRFDGQDWQSDENTHWHDCVQGDAKGDERQHDWDKGIITREATEEQAGERTFTCETCGATRTEAVEYVPPEDDIKDERQEAKDALDEVAQKKKDEIDNSDMSDEEKEAARKKVDEELQKGNEAIDSATSSSGIDSVFNETKKNIEDIAINGRGSSFPWWIIIVVAGVLALAAVLIIVIVKRRQTADGEDEYDDYYDDEYDFEEAIEDNFDDGDF